MWPPFFKMAGAFFNVAAIFQDGSGFLRPMLRRCLCYRSKGEQGGGAGQVMVSACLFS